MDVSVLGVGAIVEINEAKFMITGYRLVETDGMVGLAYLIVPYPLGYVGVDSVSLISADADYRVVAPEFISEESQTFNEMLVRAWDEGKKTSFEAYAQVMSERYFEAEEGEEDE